MSDGAVVFNTRLDNSQLIKDLAQLRKAMLRFCDDLSAGKAGKSALTEQLEAAKKELSEIQAKTKYVGKDTFSISPENVARIQELQGIISETEKEIEKQNSALENTQSLLEGVKNQYDAVAQSAAQGDSSAAAQGLQESAARTQSVFANLRASFHELQEDTETFEARFASIQRVFSAISSGAGRVAKTLGSMASTAVGKLTSGLKSAASSIVKMMAGGKAISKSFGGISSELKKIAPALLSVRRVIGILRKAVSAFMEQNQQLSNTLSNAWLNLGNLLGPIITKVVSLVSNAISYVTQFLNLLGLTGKTASQQISNAGSAAKKETDKLKKQLMSFDELNVLNDTESDSGSGGGTAASGNLADVTLPNWAQLMAEQLKSEQFAEAARTLTTALNDMVNQVNWSGIGVKVGKALDGAMTFLATAINTLDWSGLGGRLAQSVNSMISSVDWSNLGVILWSKFKIILETLTGFLMNLDMVQLAQAANNIVISFFDSMSETIQTVDWSAIGEQIGEFLANIDWGGIATTIWGVIKAAASGLWEAVKGIFKGLFADSIKELEEWGLDSAEAFVGGIVVGIIKWIAGIGVWIYDNILVPFINAFKEAFGIHSPSTVMAEQGGYIIDGLLNGITGGWRKITEWLGSALSDIKDGFANAWNVVRDTTASIWDGIVSTVKGAVNGVIGVINRMISTVVNGVNSLFSLLSFSIDLPGVGSVGLSLPQFTAPQIPYLAEGAVIPPKAPFMAVLGDQTNGNNIEAPESLIRKIVREETAGLGSNDRVEQLLEALISVVENIEVGDEVIGKAAARYIRRTNRALGV